MRRNPPQPANLADRVEIRPAPAAQAGNVVPALARLLRRPQGPRAARAGCRINGTGAAGWVTKRCRRDATPGGSNAQNWDTPHDERKS